MSTASLERGGAIRGVWRCPRSGANPRHPATLKLARAPARLPGHGCDCALPVRGAWGRAVPNFAGLALRSCPDLRGNSGPAAIGMVERGDQLHVPEHAGIAGMVDAHAIG